MSEVVYQLRVRLLEIEPAIWRRVQLPGTVTLAPPSDVTDSLITEGAEADGEAPVPL